MFGMKIEDVKESRDTVQIITTGAIYIIKKSSLGEILCHQRLGTERRVAKLILRTSLETLGVNYTDKESCFLHQTLPDLGIQIRINADSLLSIRTGRKLKVTYKANWLPEYSAFEKGNFICIDSNGGIAAYPIVSHWMEAAQIPEVSKTFSKDGWQISIFLQENQTLLTSVFPPRPFDWEKSIKDRIVHYFYSALDTGEWNPYPSDKEIEKYSKQGNILVLHYWLQGFKTRTGQKIRSREEMIKEDAAWVSFLLKATDEKELRRVLKRAHVLGMRVIPYMSPLTFPGEPQEFLKQMTSVLKEYEFDGVYFDGVASHILEAYAIMRGARKVLREKTLYVHVPSPIIGKCYKDGYYVYCPFIDTYADYILRAEHIAATGEKTDFNRKYLRYTISGYNISNTVGYICNYDYPPSITQKLIPEALQVHIRIPYWVGWDTYVRERKKAMGEKYYSLEESREIMREKYFPKLDALVKKK